MVFLLLSWVISDYDKVQRHEELEKQLISYYRGLGMVKSFRYFSHGIGHDQNPGIGRLEIYEFENLATLEKFFEDLWKNEKVAKILNEKLQLINPVTIRLSLIHEKNRELWFGEKPGQSF